tara:strand:- start:97 stop:522 length:426 start_codon:yes stop_codon:yes gene_type:complete
MGTRAIYIFEDEHEEVHVYKHYDNYPLGAVDFIENAKEYAWELPRFEADEFAAAFVAANKNRKGGEVRLVNARFKDRDAMLEANHWCDYHYVISKHNSQDLWIEIFESRYDMDSDDTAWVLIDELTHTEMKEKYGERAIAI